MLQPRYLLLFRQCTSCLRSSSNKSHFSSYRALHQEKKSSPSSPFFIPAASVNPKPSFKDSPIKSVNSENSFLESTRQITIDNFSEFDQKRFPQTGKYSGRTVSCQIGRFEQALSTLNKITRENRVAEEHKRSLVRYTPSRARQILRSGRHRIRFKQGVARLANIVLGMRKKSY